MDEANVTTISGYGLTGVQPEDERRHQAKWTASPSLCLHHALCLAHPLIFFLAFHSQPTPSLSLPYFLLSTTHTCNWAPAKPLPIHAWQLKRYTTHLLCLHGSKTLVYGRSGRLKVQPYPIKLRSARKKRTRWRTRIFVLHIERRKRLL